MFKKLSTYILIIMLSFAASASEDSISQFTYGYLKRVNDFLSEGDYENAEKELSIISKRYFLNEQSYERSLINQLWGNLYATIGDYQKAIDSYEASLRFRKIPLITNLQVRANLAQCYFQTKDFDKVIETLLTYKNIAEQRGQEFSPQNMILLGIAYYYLENFEEAYNYISAANDNSLKYKEDWLKYELALAVKLNKINDAIDVGQILVYINPDKKEYWKQVSGLYYTQAKDSESLAGLELAFDNQLLEENKEYQDLARYYLYKGLPQKAVKVLIDGLNKQKLDENKENLELIADSFFIARDRKNGIIYLEKSLGLEPDPDVAFKIARFGFEDENWNLANKFFNKALQMGWDKTPGRIELLLGITQYELGNLQKSLSFFNIAKEEEDTKTAAEGWISYIDEIVKNS
jgi:tetratricopeptide (TPR) repeat protein|tara:strand:+ start:18626 stop:19843 length:1218 start_codon:yes stop_codon:yes gene_type:complete